MSGRCRGVSRWWWVVIVIGVLVGSVQPAGAQTDVDNARAVVQQWLLEELGKPGLILVEYTYAGTSWEDSSLGCPVPGETYTPGLVNGYSWTFLYDNRVLYEVHSGLTGTPAVLCRSSNTAPDESLTAYTSTIFTILVPESWLVFPRTGGDVLFAPSPDITCDQPGMRVVVMGRVANGVTADQLLDQQIAEIGVSESSAGRIPVGVFGRSTTYDLVCDNDSRGWRVSAFVEYGSAYRVEQWAPADSFAQWDLLFTDMLNLFGPAGTVAAPGGETSPEGSGEGDSASGADQATAAPADLPALPLAHVFVGDVFLGTLNDVPGRTVTSVPTFERRYLAFSPDGLYLSFIDVTNAQLNVLNTVEGRSPRRVAEGVDPRFPPAWNLDSSQVAYVVDSGERDADGAALLAIHTVPVTGGDAQQMATFSFGGDCPAASADPADAAYDLEAVQTLVLAWLPEDRFLVSTRCDGGLGVLLVADGSLVELGGDLAGGALSPDHLQFMARADQGLALLDFVQWQRANLSLGAGAERLAWGPDGQTLYFATAALTDSVTLDDPGDAARGEGFFGMWPVTLGVYDLALVRLDLTSDNESVIWQGQGRGIGRIAPAPDGSGLLFSVVPSSLPLAEVFRSGGDSLTAHEAWPGPVLYWLPAGSSTARLVAYSGQPAFAPVTVPEQ